MKGMLERVRKDGWIFALIGICAVLCIALGSTENATQTDKSKEARLAQVLSAMEGAGKVEVAVFYQDEKETIPCGAVVVADGAKDVSVQLRLTRAIMTLMGLDNDQISIFQRKEE